ncbi:MAG TPA: response regulator [Kofleriaceae bacterium]|nr:response regulator [Kofleriaceae bacterium]
MDVKTILLMDDSEIVLEVASEALESAGFAVLKASNLAQLDDHQAQHTFDLVVLDVQMPEIYGDDVGVVMKQVRAVEVPVVLFSSIDRGELAARAREAGLEAAVSKNDGVDALVERIKQLLADG